MPLIGRVPLAALRRGDVKRMVDELAVTVSPRTAVDSRDALRVALRLQVDLEVIPANPCTGVRAPTAETKPARFLTVEEAGRVQAAADEENVDPMIGPFVALALATGMRRGELEALPWGPEGLDVAVGTVRVAVSLDRSGNLGATKNRKARSVPIGPETISRMRRWRLASGRPGDGERVFTARHREAWVRVRTAARLADPQPRLHDLRHTAATFFLAAGLRSHAVAELLGLADAGLVDRLYGHALPDEINTAGEAVEAWIATRFATRATASGGNPC
jgi:integrase